MAKDLKENFRKAPLWVTIEQGAGRLVRVSASILLARILVPEDFGVYALSLSILEMARMFGNIGIGTTVIQSSDEPDEHLNSAFWINLCASVFMFVCSVACGWVGSQYLSSPLLVYTVPMLGITLLTGAIPHINHSLLIRRLEFKTLAKASFGKLAIESVVSVAFALAGFGVWAFIIGYLLGDFTFSILIWKLTTWRPQWKPQFVFPKRYWVFGVSIFFFEFSNYLLEHIPNLILGRLTTIYILGLFAFAWRHGRWLAEVPRLIGRNYLFPAFSRLQKDKVEFQRYYERWLRFMLVWVAPLFILQFNLVHLYLPTIFGDKWIPAIQTLQVFIFLGFFEVTFFVPHLFALNAMGEVRYNTYWNIIESVTKGLALVIASGFGLMAIAMSMLIVRVIILPLFVFFTFGKLKIDFYPLLRNITPTILLCVLGWLVVPLLQKASLAWFHYIPIYLLIGFIWTILGVKFVPEIRTLVAHAFGSIQTVAFNSKSKFMAVGKN